MSADGSPRHARVRASLTLEVMRDMYAGYTWHSVALRHSITREQLQRFIRFGSERLANGTLTVRDLDVE